MINITAKRIERLIREFTPRRYPAIVPLRAEVTVDSDPIPLADIGGRKFRSIDKDEKWGELWDSAWFRFTGQVPSDWNGKTVVALLDIGGEGCVFRNGRPYCGITYKKDGDFLERKRRVRLYDNCRGGEDVEILVEGAANGLFGDNFPFQPAWPFFRLNQAELAVLDEDVWTLSLDLEFLLDLWKALDPATPRAKRIGRGLNTIANLTPLENRIAEAAEITAALISVPTTASAGTAWSVGHAHLDLAWLWRYRETRRKSGRTFSTALRMLEEYPEYIFGASQPQLFQWMKEDYPELYEDVRHRVDEGRIECQGGMWVEPDMNIPGGESLVRQCLYGKMFFRKEFNRDVTNLWLPDVFGYSAALPQILRKAGIDFFVTQKISWNETNEFPHHTFMWYGIDGTPVQSHFLPTDTYNASNEPSLMTASIQRYSQSDVRDGFLNLYGIGDGGGGPSRRHIEMLRRGRDCEGMPRMKSSRADAFLQDLKEQESADLPVWKGELYLELHRGTYTTQARMKKLNRRSEHLLRDAEIVGAVAKLSREAEYPKEHLEAAWKATLCNQFHDVLPGSSIREVYVDAHAIAEETISKLERMESETMAVLFDQEADGSVTLVNTQPWSRREWIRIGERDIRVEVPAIGAVTVNPADMTVTMDGEVAVSEDLSTMENNRVALHLDPDGTISSMRLKTTGNELLRGGANRFLMYEDVPYFWDAWDVSPYYRETVPEQAQLIGRRLIDAKNSVAQIEQIFSIGRSRIVQILELRSDETLIRSSCRIDWREEEKMLRLSSVPDVSWPTATYEIQFGTLERPTHRNTSWDEAQFEVCGHRFADYSQPDRGLALMNDCKYGYRIQEGVMELNLLRSPKYPDPDADRGEQELAFAYLPHDGDYRSAGIVQAAHEFNSPIKIVEGRTNPDLCGKPWFSTDNPAVRIETVKMAEDGEGVVIRCYETMGGTATCRMHSAFRFSEATETDLLEENGQSLRCSDSGVDMVFGPFEIKTIRLK